jgi:hypothetical protein
MGNRPSRQRRHLPTSVTLPVKTRSPKNQHMPLLNMTFGERSSAKQLVEKSNRKHVLQLISACWILFIAYRVCISLQKEDYDNLSIVHFISKMVTRCMHEPSSSR